MKLTSAKSSGNTVYSALPNMIAICSHRRQANPRPLTPPNYLYTRTRCSCLIRVQSTGYLEVELLKVSEVTWQVNITAEHSAV